MKNNIFSTAIARKAVAMIGAIAMLLGVAACGQANSTDGEGTELKKVTFMLSWAPDTNHIGVYVAKNKGYFKQAGLDVDIVAVAQAGAEQAVNNGQAGRGTSKRFIAKTVHCGYRTALRQWGRRSLERWRVADRRTIAAGGWKALKKSKRARR